MIDGGIIPWSSGELFTRANEGCRLVSYQDTLGYWTIGYGHQDHDVSQDLVWSQRQADAAFSVDYAGARFATQRILDYVGFHTMSPARQAAVVDMVFQLGPRGFGEFKKLIAAIKAADWVTAAAEAKASQWAKQVPNRSARVEAMLLSGEFLETP